MNELTIPINITDELITEKIHTIRGQKVMIDRDLSELYGVETKRLKEAVRRNKERFPEDFMFEMRKSELDIWRSHFATSKSEVMGVRHLPFCFTEQGVAMLSSILNSKRAIEVNIQIIRIFTKMRQIFDSHNEILHKLEELKTKEIEQDEKSSLVFEYLKQLEQSNDSDNEYRNRKKIGYKHYD